MKRSAACVEHSLRGPFPGATDPWAEAGRYFHQIHHNWITVLLSTLQRPLLERGYMAGREASLQILQRREPDVLIRREDAAPQPPFIWDYRQAA